MSEIKKIFYSMGEVSEMLDVNPSLLRFWEKKFDLIRPKKNKKGNRLFSPEDVRNLKIIYHLVKENGMTLAGAQKRLKQNRADIEREMELSERLHAIKALLLEVKQQIDDDSDTDMQIIIPEQPITDTEEADNLSPIVETSSAESSVEEMPDDEIAEENLEREIESAFAAETVDDEEEWYDEEEDSFEPEDDCEQSVDDDENELAAMFDTSDIEYAQQQCTEFSEAESEQECELPNVMPEDESQDDEPQTEIIMEEGMLFAVEALKPKPIVETAEPEQEPKQTVDEGPRIIEQTLF